MRAACGGQDSSLVEFHLFHSSSDSGHSEAGTQLRKRALAHQPAHCPQDHHFWSHSCPWSGEQSGRSHQVVSSAKVPKTVPRDCAGVQALKKCLCAAQCPLTPGKLLELAEQPLKSGPFHLHKEEEVVWGSNEWALLPVVALTCSLSLFTLCFLCALNPFFFHLQCT